MSGGAPSTSSPVPAGPPSMSARNSFFTITSSPPLIIAFLAVGFFTIGVLILLFYRSISGTRFQPLTRKQSRDFGQKPELWDICSKGSWPNIADPSAKIPDHWHTITVGIIVAVYWVALTIPSKPLAATLLSSTSDGLSKSTSPQPIISHTASSYPIPSFSAIPLLQLSKRSKTSKKTTSEVREPNLQIAALISMPSPSRDLDGDVKIRMPDEGGYHIGLSQVFCSGAEDLRQPL